MYFRLALLVTAFVQLLLIDQAFAQTKQNRDYCLNSGHTRIFLVDVTTEYDATDKSSIVGMIEKVFETAKGGDRIVVRTISDSHTKSEKVVERCLPQCPAEGTLDRLFKCSDGVIRTDTAIARKDILEALRNRLSKFEETKYSDVIRTINAVAKEETRSGQATDLYIYSDLIENSEGMIPTINFFRYPVPTLIENLKRFGMIAPLVDFEIQVAGVGRAGTKDRRPLSIGELNFLTTFWTAYFKEAGAKRSHIGQNATAN